MGISERKERERAELRSRILEAAERLFAQEGFPNVSMRKIGREIEYAPTTIYRYFKNKDEIMEHLMTQGYEGVRERYRKVLDDPGPTPFDTLARLIMEYADYGLHHPDHYRLWHSASDLHMDEGHLCLRKGGRSLPVYEAWMDLIEACQEAGQFRQGETFFLFQLVWGSVHGFISLRLNHPEIPWPPMEDQVEAVVSLLKAGLRAG